MPISAIFVLVEIKLSNQNFKNIIDKTSKIIQSGGIAILPFDTVYGFVCDPRNEEALQKIYELKKRPAMKTIGLAANNIETVDSISEVNDTARKYIEEKTPGKYTFIVRKRIFEPCHSRPEEFTPLKAGESRNNALKLDPRVKPEDDNMYISEFCVQNGTVGVRIPDSKLILRIAEKCGGLIAQTSANISGQGNCYSITDIKNQYAKDALNQIDLIIDGGILKNNGASRLIDLTGDTPCEIKR